MKHNEILRFGLVRNPLPLSKDRAASIAIPVIYSSYRYFPLAEKLKEQRLAGANKAVLRGLANSQLADAKFLPSLDALPQFRDKFLIVMSWAQANASALDGQAVSQKIEKIFGFGPDELITKIRTNKVRIADSLVVVFVSKKIKEAHRAQLQFAFRFIFLIERLAEQADLGVREVNRSLTAELLLPKEIFPLPDRNEEFNAVQKALRQEKLDKQAAAAALVEELTTKIQQNEQAIDDLAEQHTQYLETVSLDTVQDPVYDTNPGEEVVTRLTISRFQLPDENLRKLKPGTIQALSTNTIRADKQVYVPTVVQKLEQFNQQHAQQIQSLQAKGDIRLIHIPIPGECKPAVVEIAKIPNDFSMDTRGEVKVVGVQDLLKVEQSLHRYETGEIAHIENILEGEYKDKKHRKLQRTMEETFVETEETEESEEELQSTERFELQKEVAKTISEDTSLEAGVTVTASYGKVDIEAHGNYAYSRAKEESQQIASNYAKDVIDRSVKKLTARTLNRRSTIRTSEVEVINEHGFDNKEGTGHVRGVYRWVDKYYRAQMMNYGRRLMLEFMIPEPAAFYKFAQQQQQFSTLSAIQPPAPGFCISSTFRPLRPADIQPYNYLAFVGMYNVEDVDTAPPRYATVTESLQYKNEDDTEKAVSFAATNDKIKLPEGYKPLSLRYRITGTNAHSVLSQNSGNNRDDNILVVVTIGDKRVFTYYKNEVGDANGDYWDERYQTVLWRYNLHSSETAKGSFQSGFLNGEFVVKTNQFTDHVPLSLNGHTTLPMSLSIHYSIQCERTPETLQRWQMDTYSAIMNAYQAQLAAYEEALRAQAFEDASLVNIQGRNPAINRALESDELKKYAITMLTGQHFDSFNAMGADPIYGIPQPDLIDAAEEAAFVGFFEQVLEWRHINYLFYPYFWGNKANWNAQINLQDNDPLFEKFLRAGYARVWVPVRPGFEQAILSYITHGGEPWQLKDAPLTDAEDTNHSLSLIDELKEHLGNDFVSQKGLVQLIAGSDIVKVVGETALFEKADLDREILLDMETYRIVEILADGQSVRLDRPSPTDHEAGISFAFGARYVGEPWLVKLPTNLVFLQADDAL